MNALLYGDCLDVMKRLEANSVDLVLTDPPYLANYRSRDGRGVINDDNDAWLQPAFRELHRVLKPSSYAISFYGWPHADRFVTAFKQAGFRTAGHFVFPKTYSSASRHVGYRHECAYLLAKGNPRPQRVIPDVLPWHYTGNRLHPNQKPLCILEQLITAFSSPGELVLDPFAGSGSTLLAARNLGRRYLGIELDAAYHAIACSRLARLRPLVKA